MSKCVCVCDVSRVVFLRLLGSEERDVLEHCELESSFWAVFARLYVIVSKWAKKTKHALFCYDLMVTMICFGPKDFFFSTNHDDVLKLIVGGLKKDDLRAGCIELIRNFCFGGVLVRDVDPEFFREDMDAFTGQMRFIMAALIQKKKSIAESESTLIEEILIEIGRKHVHFLVTEIAVEMLKPKGGYSDAQKVRLIRHSIRGLLLNRKRLFS